MVTVSDDGRALRRQVELGSAGGHGSTRLHFGLGDLGDRAEVDVSVRWPDGTVSEYPAVAVDRSVVLGR